MDQKATMQQLELSSRSVDLPAIHIGAVHTSSPSQVKFYVTGLQRLKVAAFAFTFSTYPLTMRIIGAPQFPLFFSVLHCLLGLGELQACLFPGVVFPPLFLSALSSSPFHCALQDSFDQT